MWTSHQHHLQYPTRTPIHIIYNTPSTTHHLQNPYAPSIYPNPSPHTLCCFLCAWCAGTTESGGRAVGVHSVTSPLVHNLSICTTNLHLYRILYESRFVVHRHIVYEGTPTHCVLVARKALCTRGKESVVYSWQGKRMRAITGLYPYMYWYYRAFCMYVGGRTESGVCSGTQSPLDLMCLER